MSHIAPLPPRISSWDRAAIVSLGAAGCALSYDALQQMATAIHIRGILTFVFPLVIDGFIAYGVRALLVLRTAPLASRCYVWTLFATATAASIWANALHAVRLNQQQPEGDGLRLGDLTVGILSTLAPLALAGAVHLYILIARRVTEAEASGDVEVTSARATTSQGSGPELPLKGSRLVATEAQNRRRGEEAATAMAGQPEKSPGTEPERAGHDADQDGEPASRPRPVTRLHVAGSPATAPTDRPETGGRRGAAVTDDQLMTIAREAVAKAGGDLTRKIVADAIRGDGHGLGNDRLTRLMESLRKEAEEGPDTRIG